MLSRAKSLLYAAEIPLIRFAAQKRKSPAPEGADAGLTSALKTGVSGLRRLGLNGSRTHRVPFDGLHRTRDRRLARESREMAAENKARFA